MQNFGFLMMWLIYEGSKYLGHNQAMLPFVRGLLEQGCWNWHQAVMLNPYMTNELAHHYHLGESTVIFRHTRSDLIFLFFDEIPLS